MERLAKMEKGFEEFEGLNKIICIKNSMLSLQVRLR